MRFSDVTLEGLMKEFEQISKASEGSEQTYTLPQDLLDQPTAVADVPFYDEMLKTTASERSKLYGAVGDSKILDEAHPKGSAKLEGLNGEEVTVEDLQDMKKKFEEVVHSTVKAKKAALVKKLKKLAKQLQDGGHTKFASDVEAQLKKLSYGDEDLDKMQMNDMKKPQEVTFDDKDALTVNVSKPAPQKVNPADKQKMLQIQKMVNHYLITKKKKGRNVNVLNENGNVGDAATWDAIRNHLYLVPGKHFRNYDQLLAILPQHIQSLLPDPFVPKSASSVQSKLNKLAEEMTFGDEDALVTDVPKSRDITMEMGEPTVTNVPKPKTDVQGLARVSEIIDIFEQPLMDILGPPHYTGTVRTWSGLDKDLRKYFNLYPSNVTNLPAGAKTYKNWQQLAALVREGLDKWKYLSDNLQMGEGTEHNKAKGDQPASIDMQKLREGLVPGPGAVPTGKKGPPVAPQLPLSMQQGRGPSR